MLQKTGSWQCSQADLKVQLTSNNVADSGETSLPSNRAERPSKIGQHPSMSRSSESRHPLIGTTSSWYHGSNFRQRQHNKQLSKMSPYHRPDEARDATIDQSIGVAGEKHFLGTHDERSEADSGDEAESALHFLLAAHGLYWPEVH